MFGSDINIFEDESEFLDFCEKFEKLSKRFNLIISKEVMQDLFRLRSGINFQKLFTSINNSKKLFFQQRLTKYVIYFTISIVVKKDKYNLSKPTTSEVRELKFLYSENNQSFIVGLL